MAHCNVFLTFLGLNVKYVVSPKKPKYLEGLMVLYQTRETGKTDEFPQGVNNYHKNIKFTVEVRKILFTKKAHKKMV